MIVESQTDELPEPPQTINAAVVTDGIVNNVIVLETMDDFPPPEGSELIEVTQETGGAAPGCTWNGTIFGPDPNAIPLA